MGMRSNAFQLRQGGAALQCNVVARACHCGCLFFLVVVCVVVGGSLPFDRRGRGRSFAFGGWFGSKFFGGLWVVVDNNSCSRPPI